jgi:hypothetical protein
MAIVLVNPAGNTPQGDHAQGDTLIFAPAPEPGPRHGEGVVVLYSSLPAVQDEHPAGDVIQGNFIGTEGDRAGLADQADLDLNVRVFATVDPPEAPPQEDSRGLWQINIDPAQPEGAHVAISLGDDGDIEAISIVVSSPPVFDFLF